MAHVSYSSILGEFEVFPRISLIIVHELWVGVIYQWHLYFHPFTAGVSTMCRCCSQIWSSSFSPIDPINRQDETDLSKNRWDSMGNKVKLVLLHFYAMKFGHLEGVPQAYLEDLYTNHGATHHLLTSKWLFPFQIDLLCLCLTMRKKLKGNNPMVII